MKTTTRISRAEYIRLMFTVSYRNKMLLLLTILWSWMLPVGLAISAGKIKSGTPGYMFIVFGLLAWVGLPLMIYRSARKQYDASKQLQEPVEYEFEGNTMRVNGSAFSAELDLAQSDRILELSRWILIYESQSTANIVSKRDMSPAELGALLELLHGLPENVKKTMKK